MEYAMKTIISLIALFAFTIVQPVQAGSKQQPNLDHLSQYSKVSPKWKFTFDVADGILHADNKVKCNYNKDNMLIVDGDNGVKALRLTHLKKGYQAIMIKDPALTRKGAGVLLAEWKIKYLKGVEDKGGFHIVFKPMNPKKQGLLCNLQFFSNKIIAPWGTIKLKESIKNNWVIFRIAIDVKKEVALLWMNGRKIGGGKVPLRKKMKPGIFFGDGSSAVAGQVEIEYLKITTVEYSSKSLVPGVLLTFDDHSTKNWVKFIPLFKRYGARATFFVDRWDKLSPEQINDLKKLKKAGHSVGCHSLRHRNMVTYSKKNSISQYITNEIMPAVKFMRKDGFTPTCFAYPSSARNTKTDAALFKVFKYLRAGSGWGKPISEANRIFTPLNQVGNGSGLLFGTSVQPHSGTDPILLEVEKAFKRCKLKNEIVVFYAHDIRSNNTAGPSHYITPDGLEAILKKAKAIGLQFYTFDDLT
jgi:peptidoglycan/xylan/chitin deacetylase (PgdA/CDA1 family)